MTIHLVSHAEAVPLDAWQLADDALRPLTTMGYAQATALARQLGSVPLDIVLAAPTSRCIDTVLLATVAHGLEIRTRHDLLHRGATALAGELLHGRNQALLCADSAVIADLLMGLDPQCSEPMPGDQAAVSLWTVEQTPDGLRARRHPAMTPSPRGEGGWPRRPRRSGVVVGGGGRY